jgi:hypothetical protein
MNAQELHDKVKTALNVIGWPKVKFDKQPTKNEPTWFESLGGSDIPVWVAQSIIESYLTDLLDRHFRWLIEKTGDDFYFVEIVAPHKAKNFCSNRLSALLWAVGQVNKDD